MTLARILLSRNKQIVSEISRDSKIYEAFKPYISGILGINIEDFMANEELRRIYRQKYATIKDKFQKESLKQEPMKDEECFIKIAAYSKGWQEFIVTAMEHTLDNGQSFIENMPLDKYILMTDSERACQEQRLVDAAVAKIRSLFAQSDTTEMNRILSGENNSTAEHTHIHKG